MFVVVEGYESNKMGRLLVEELAKRGRKAVFYGAGDFNSGIYKILRERKMNIYARLVLWVSVMNAFYSRVNMGDVVVCDWWIDSVIVNDCFDGDYRIDMGDVELREALEQYKDDKIVGMVCMWLEVGGQLYKNKKFSGWMFDKYDNSGEIAERMNVLMGVYGEYVKKMPEIVFWGRRKQREEGRGFCWAWNERKYRVGIDRWGDFFRSDVWMVVEMEYEDLGVELMVDGVVGWKERVRVRDGWQHLHGAWDEG